MGNEDLKFLRALKERARAVLDDLESRVAEGSSNESETDHEDRIRIAERFRSVIEDAEASLREHEGS